MFKLAAVLVSVGLLSCVLWKPVFAAGPIYWGAWIDGSTYGRTSDAPWDSVTWDTFESHTQRKVSIVHFGNKWKNNGTFLTFSNTPFDDARARGAIPFVDWGAMDSSAVDANFRSSMITNGTYDSYITSWLSAAKNWGHPMFVRLGWEMNGWWQFPWSEGLESDGTVHNGNAPGDYANAWRHIVDKARSLGVTNITWVWCPNIAANDKASNGAYRYASLSQIYPGNSYVDWTCIDGYNKYSTWLSFSQLFGGASGSWFRNTYTDVNTISSNKPMIIGEFASQEAGGSKAGWITSALGSEIPNNFPNIKAILWFNWDDNAGLPWPIETSTTAQSAFASSINSGYYGTNSYATLNTSPIQPIAQATTLNFGFKLQGVSAVGKTDTVTVAVRNGSGSVTTFNGVAVTSDASGIFRPNTPVTLSGVASGSYDVLVKDATHLRKKLGTMTITSGVANVAPSTFNSVALTAGDFSNNNIFNIMDLSALLAKYTALTVSVNTSNQMYDANLDGVINDNDVGLVLANYTALQVFGD